MSNRTTHYRASKQQNNSSTQQHSSISSTIAGKRHAFRNTKQSSRLTHLTTVLSDAIPFQLQELYC